MTNGYALEIVQMVIDERYKTKKPLIVTTNLSKEEMDHPANMDYWRIFDRLGEMCAAPMFFDGPSLREEIRRGKARFAAGSASTPTTPGSIRRSADGTRKSYTRWRFCPCGGPE